MATQTIEFPASTGRASGATVKVYPVGSDTAAATASAVVESTNRKAIYQATFASLSGNYLLAAIDSNGVPMCVDALTGVTDTAATFQTNSISNNDPNGVTTLLSRIGGPITITSGGVLVHSVDTGGITAASFAAAALSAVLTTQMTESYRAAGVAPTLAQAVFEIVAGILDHSISGTTKTIRKIDGTAAKTYTLDAIPPTSITETT